VRKPPEVVAPSSSPRRLALALLCAFAGCLNPRPEEYPSDTASPGAEAAGAAAADDSARQGGDAFEPNIAGDPNDAPELEEPSEPPLPPQLIVPAPGVDAGAGDAGASDAGAPAISE
jgi:hypothetical protein